LGSSLGINLLPSKGKLCNFDCIYCECGWNKDGLGDRLIPNAADVYSALSEKLAQCAEDGTPIDSITFSGDGEPTLNPEFPQIIRDTIALRDKYYPSAKVSVLSNATRICREPVFEALKLVDNPILKLDAPSNELADKINRPAGEYDVESVVRDLEKFEGNFILQTMFLKSEDFDSSNPEILEAWKQIVRRLNPREIMVYTIDRPTPQNGLQKFSETQMRSLVQDLLDEGMNIQIKA